MAITKTKTATDCHIKSVLCDPEYIREYKLLIDNPDKNILLPKLLNQYGLVLEDFEGEPNNGLMLYMNPNTMFSAGRLDYNPELHEFVATFKADLKREQLNELWCLINKNQNKLGITKTKPKAPHNSKLLYAIFKARKNRITFTKIYKLYECGELPYYNGPNRQYKWKDSLERYYRRYYNTDI